MLTSSAKPLFQLHIRQRSATSGPFLFLADHGLSAEIWQFTAAHLPTECGWLTVDLIGSGHSPAPRHVRAESADTDPWDVAMQVDTLYRVIQDLELPPLVLVGHGFGALVAEQFANQFPDCLLGVALVSPLNQHLAAWRQTLAARTPDLLTRRPLAPECAEAYSAAGGAAPESWDAVERHIREMAHVTEVAGLRLPVLILCGDRAPFTSLSDAVALQGRLRQGCLCVLNDVGHLPMLEAPEQSAQALLRFLRDCPGQRPHSAPGAWGGHIECVWPERLPDALGTGAVGQAAPPGPETNHGLEQAYIEGHL